MVKISVKDKTVEGEEVSFQSRREEWNEYIIEDGTTVKVKLVATNIFKTDQVTPAGEPVYIVKSQNVMSVTPLKKLDKTEIQ